VLFCGCGVLHAVGLYEVGSAAKLEELRVGAVSHDEEWLRRALSQISRDELRPLTW